MNFELIDETFSTVSNTFTCGVSHDIGEVDAKTSKCALSKLSNQVGLSNPVNAYFFTSSQLQTSELESRFTWFGIDYVNPFDPFSEIEEDGAIFFDDPHIFVEDYYPECTISASVHKEFVESIDDIMLLKTYEDLQNEIIVGEGISCCLKYQHICFSSSNEFCLDLRKYSSYLAVIDYARQEIICTTKEQIKAIKQFKSSFWKESLANAQLQQKKDLAKLEALDEKLKNRFLNRYHEFFEKNANPFIAWERGLILARSGKYYESLQDIYFILSKNPTNLSSHTLLEYGQVLSDLGKNEEALDLFTKSINKDPYNFAAYFERACIHFEMGNIDLAVNDYKKSQVNDEPIAPELDEKFNTLAFSTGLIKGLSSGIHTCLNEFIPSMLSTISGLSHGIWAFCTDPKEVSISLINSVRSCVQFLKEHSTKEVLQNVVPELKELVEKWSSLSDFRKGEIVGQIIGKHGTDVFLFSGISKSVRLCRNLKKANAAMALKAVSESKLTKDLILNSTKQWNSISLKHLEFIKKNKLDIKFGKDFSKVTSEIEIRKIIHNAGIATFRRPKNIPANWNVRISEKGLGMQYINPKKPNEYVRVMPGNPNSKWKNQRKPYVIHRDLGGSSLDKNGKKLLSRKCDEAHIPLDDYDFSKIIQGQKQ